MSRRIVVMIGLAIVVAAGAFVVLLTRARADDVCERERFVPADGLSLWPPGVRCSFGEPQQTDVFLNPWWLGFVLLVTGATMAATLDPRRRRPSRVRL
jgi:hypothetical protein